MENIKFEKKYENSYYVEGEKDFTRLNEVISLMPNYAIKGVLKSSHTDYFYETEGRLLEQLEASIRIRVEGDAQTLSIICKNNGISREFVTEMILGDNISDKREYLLFLEDKLQDIYTHRIDADIVRLLKGLKVFMFIATNRKTYEIINNSGFKCLVHFDNVEFNCKRHKIKDYVLEVKMDCFNGIENLTAYERFIKQLEQKVLIVPMQETKYDAGKRIFNYEY